MSRNNMASKDNPAFSYFVNISSLHISPDDISKLEVEANFLIWEYPGGYVINTHSLTELKFDHMKGFYSKELIDILSWACECGYDGVQFDCDGVIYEDFPLLSHLWN